jgi:hypothetical protein
LAEGFLQSDIAVPAKHGAQKGLIVAEAGTARVLRDGLGNRLAARKSISLAVTSSEQPGLPSWRV